MNSSSENINVREASVFLKIWAKIKETFSPKDMSVGSPAKRIAEFAVPMLIGNIAQQLYNTVDTIVVGKYVGDNAISAVGGAAPVLNLMLALMIGLSTGVGILVSQYFGAKDREMLSTSIGNCITLTAIGSAIIMVVGSFAAAPLLRALDTPEGEIFNWCRDYLMVCFIGIVGTFYYNILSGVLRGMGDSFSALGFLVISASLNIVLDLWFVAGLGLEVFGVALATVISQAISAFCCFLKMMRMKAVFDIKPKYFKLTKITVETLRLGIPSGLTQAIFSVAMLIVQRLTNSFGETVMAANVVVMRVDGFAMMPNFSFGQAMTMYTGQNVGARKFDRIKKGTVQGTVMAVSVSAAFLGLILLFGHTIMGLFTNTEELIEMIRHDVHSRRGICRHGRHPKPCGRNARRRRHHDPYVDIPLHDRRSARARRLCYRLFHQKPQAPRRRLPRHSDIAFGLLARRHACSRHSVFVRQMEKAHSRLPQGRLLIPKILPKGIISPKNYPRFMQTCVKRGIFILKSVFLYLKSVIITMSEEDGHIKALQEAVMKGYSVSNGYMGYVDGRYMLFVSQEEYREYYEDNIR